MEVCPQINNTDHGIWRRIKAIPFNRTFSAEEQDRNLAEKLMSELPGILNAYVFGMRPSAICDCELS